MIYQKPISFKIDLDVLDDLNRFIETTGQSNRNRIINIALSRHLELKRIQQLEPDKRETAVRQFLRLRYGITL